jgi:hypothetical protein
MMLLPLLLLLLLLLPVHTSVCLPALSVLLASSSLPFSDWR